MIGFTGKALSSERLTFRLLEECDKPALAEIMRESETTLPAGVAPVTDPAAFESFWEGLTKYSTGIAILLNGRCIGYFHVNPYRPDEPEYQDKKNVGIGFLIGKSFLHRGYGEETLRTLNSFLLERFDCIWGDYFEGNAASQRLLEKCGFVPVSTYDMPFEELGGKTMHIFSNVLCG